MRVRVTRAFRDMDAGTLRDEGDEFEVSPSRLKAINSTKYGVLAVEVEEPKAEPVTGTQRATRRRNRKE